MGRILAILSLLVLAPHAAFANDVVQDYVNQAIEALRTTCYEGRMRFINQFEQGIEQQVHIYHVAPELYRVEPLAGGEAGASYYIENSVELVRVAGDFTTIMPQRRFYTNDMLTAKFLRDLGSHEGSTVLSGKVGDYDVWVLRQHAIQEKPYVITVGLDKRNYFPLFLLVSDADGTQRVYYEMEVIEYHDPMEIADHWFRYSEEKAKTITAPRVNQVPAQGFELDTKANQLSLKLSSQIPMEIGESTNFIALPLYPSELPEGYVLESIAILDFQKSWIGGSKNSQGESQVVFQMEIFGPHGDLLSIFQTPATNNQFSDIKDSVYTDRAGYVVMPHDGWLIAAFGDLSSEELASIIRGLKADEEPVRALLEETKARDLIFEQIINNSEH